MRRGESLLGLTSHAEMAAYGALVDIESTLRDTVAHIARAVGSKAAAGKKPAKPRAKKGGPELLPVRDLMSITSAADVLKLGRLRNWTL